MKSILFCVALTFSAASQAFTMSEQHCEVFHTEVSALVAQKASNVKLGDFKKYLAEEEKKAPNKQVFKEITPFIEAAAEEYYTEPDLAEVDYPSVISYNCRQAIGSSTPI